MAKEKFLLVSLKEEESKQLAQIVSNKTSRKILDYLADQDATESELSEKLGIPLSTIHYNLQALVKSKMVEADEYHYSQKGKEILHYKLANKYIIIAPKSTFGLKEKLKHILPAGILGIVVSGMLSFESFFSPQVFSESADMAVRSAPQAAIAESAMIADAGVAQALPVASQTSEALGIPSALWFLFGCIFTIVLIILIEYIIYKRKNR